MLTALTDAEHARIRTERRAWAEQQGFTDLCPGDSDAGHCCSCDDACCYCEGPGMDERIALKRAGAPS